MRFVCDVVWLRLRVPDTLRLRVTETVRETLRLRVTDLVRETLLVRVTL